MKEVVLFLGAGFLSWNTLAFLSAGLPEHIPSHSKVLALEPRLEITIQAALVELEWNREAGLSFLFESRCAYVWPAHTRSGHLPPATMKLWLLPLISLLF